MSDDKLNHRLEICPENHSSKQGSFSLYSASCTCDDNDPDQSNATPLLSVISRTKGSTWARLCVLTLLSLLIGISPAFGEVTGDKAVSLYLTASIQVFALLFLFTFWLLRKLQLSRRQTGRLSKEFLCAQRNANIVAISWSFPICNPQVSTESLRRICSLDQIENERITLFEEGEHSEQEFLQKLNHQLNAGSFLDFTFVCRGTSLNLRADVRRDAQDHPTTISGVLKKAPAETEVDKLKSLKAQFELILETANVGIYGLDQEGNTTFANNATCKMTGFSKTEILHHQQHSLFHHSYADGQPYPVEESGIYSTTQSGRPYHEEHETFWRKDGTSFPVECISSPIIIDSTVKGAVVVFSNISSRIEHENSLRNALSENEKLSQQLASENTQLTSLSSRLSLILESVSEGIYGLNMQGLSTFANKATCELTGWKPEEILGLRNHDVIHHTHPDGSPYDAKDCPIYQAFKEGVRETCDQEVFWRKDGSSFPVEYSSNPIFEDDEVIGSVVIYRDITERKAAEEQLKNAYSEIERLNQQLEAENFYLKDEIKSIYNFEKIIGESGALKKTLAQVEQVAPTDSNVLILGESGTGKELIALAVHNLSDRRDGPLIKVNCAAFQSSLIENELFGHCKDAYTGATHEQKGRFESADGGTLFLDEIGELDIEVQAKLLRALQEGEIERVGSSNPIKVDVRIIAATNKDLEEEVSTKRFRQDLYYRLNIFPITLPPLRERQDDIPLLVSYLLQKFNKKLDKNIESVPSAILEQFRNYSWPGNIRELQNVIERAVILTKGNVLQLREPLHSTGYQSGSSLQSTKLNDVERSHICKILRQVDWKIEGAGCAAELLGINASTLRSRMKKLNISKDN